MDEKRAWIWVCLAVATLFLTGLACGRQDAGPTATPIVYVATPTPGGAGAPPTLAPTTPPEPTSTSVPGSCTTAMQFVADVSIPDGTTVAAGETFVKTWRVRNSGTCDWSGYHLVFDHGEPMGTLELVIPDMPAGEEFDLSIEMTSPGGAGHYRGYWRVESAEGANLGALYCDIVVAGAEGPTEEPTEEVTEEPSEEPTEEPTVVAPPANLRLETWGLDSMTFAWDDAAGETGYILMMGAESASLPADTTSYMWENPPCGTSVNVTLIARAGSAEIGRLDLFGVSTPPCVLPNLVVVEAYFQPEEVEAGQVFVARFTVSNNSPTATGPFSIGWTFHANLGLEPCTWRHDGLAPGEQAQGSCERRTNAPPGGYRTDLRIDVNEEVGESDETDNAINLPLRVVE
ncbi:MAG: hypothetical protein JW900_11120 [Anaerolineae bacterium]|nr:hypothetical protein [Anaerolineae bacterium]